MRARRALSRAGLKSDTSWPVPGIASGAATRHVDEPYMSLKLVAIGSLVLVLVAAGLMFSRASTPSTASVGFGPGIVHDDSVVSTISNGEEVDLRQHLDPDGGYTLFEFTADW